MCVCGIAIRHIERRFSVLIGLGRLYLQGKIAVAPSYVLDFPSYRIYDDIHINRGQTN